MSKLYVAMKLHGAETTVGKLGLPARCKGIMFAFETKTAARKFMGKDCEFIQVELMARHRKR